MAFSFPVRQALPVVLSAAIIAFAGTVLYRTLQRIDFVDVLAHVRQIPTAQLAIGALLVATLFAALATYEAIAARFVNGPVSARRAAVTALIAGPIGHAIGLGALSGGAVRYRIYSAVGMRPLDVGKMVVLVALPYAAGLGSLLGLALVLRSHEAAQILHATPEVARGSGIALLALHAAYVALVLKRRAPVQFGRVLLALPPPNLTAVQYAIGAIEVCTAAGLLYVLLPPSADLSFLLFVGIYVLGILAGLASSVPAGLGVFESVLLLLLKHVPPDQLLGAVLAYRFLLELVPLAVAVVLFAGYEAWSRLPAQRARTELRLADAQARDRDPRERRDPRR
jgi:uncharacterized membrane protein YbhN (UPF0104 family)